MCRLRITINKGRPWLAGLVVWPTVRNQTLLIFILTDKALKFNCNISMISFMDLRKFNMGGTSIVISIYVTCLERDTTGYFSSTGLYKGQAECSLSLSLNSATVGICADDEIPKSPETGCISTHLPIEHS